MEYAMKKLRSRSFRPSIQSLEVRMVPSTIVADPNLGDTVGNPAGHFSLREAISFANKNPGPDTIRLQQRICQITRTGMPDNSNDSGGFDFLLNTPATHRDSLTIIG